MEFKEQNNVTPKNVATLLSKGNIVALFQGKSEAGPRALGNRSILFDPRIPNGKEIINHIKKREFFRPFAGTVLLEHVNEWFNIDRLSESPSMMYSVQVLPTKQKEIPAITHIDGTCRIQTLTKEQNLNYYNLILEFYKITGIPIVLNTSFNLSGGTVVETIADAVNVLQNSKIDYLYLPEFNNIVKNETSSIFSINSL